MSLSFDPLIVEAPFQKKGLPMATPYPPDPMTHSFPPRNMRLQFLLKRVDRVMRLSESKVEGSNPFLALSREEILF